MKPEQRSNRRKIPPSFMQLISRTRDRFTSTPSHSQTKISTFSLKTELCRLCEDIIRGYELECGDYVTSPLLFHQGPNVSVPHHPNLHSLEEAVATGCALCHRLLNSAAQNISRLKGKDEEFSTLGFIFQLQHIYWDKGMNIRWDSCRSTSRFPQGEDGDDRTLAELYLREEPKYHNSMEASTGSESTLQQIQQWYHQCNCEHKKCSASKDVSLPSRLLYIEGNSLRLCESSSLPVLWSNERPQYAALSHCWGDIDFIKLLQSNISEFLNDIPLNQLTKTFRDAITITKSLGLTFLWIDSLCIIQDSIDDWRKESALMADVYGGSAITVAAADAKNSSIGCFFQRSPKEICSLHLQTAKRSYSVTELMSQSSGVKNSLLFKRAWAFQERVLSPRILHFTRTQVFWKCRGGELASELYPMGIPSSTFSYHETLTDTMMRNPSVSRLRSWLDIVTLYSATHLTHHIDKLIALSGVAKWYQQHHKLEASQYIAGIWKDQIWHGLLWTVNGPTNGDRPTKYQAPSWSWASQNEELIFPIGSQIQFSSPYASLASHHITYPDNNVFGQVTSGHIRLKCTNLLLAPWVRDEESDNFLIDLNQESVNCRITWDHTPDRGEKTYLLPVLVYRFHNGSPNKRDRIRLQGLALQASGESPGTFRRVAYFDLMVGGRKTSSSPKLDRVLLSQANVSFVYLWREITAHFEDLEKVSRTRGYYIPEDEIYESSSTNEKDGERVHEIIII